MPDRGYSLERGGWRPGDDPLLVAEAIDIAEVDLRRFRRPLELARFQIARDVEENFATQTGPDGAHWPDWSDSYRERGERENIQLLRKSPSYHKGDETPLYDAATDPDSYIVESHSQSAGAYGGGAVALVGAALPEYWPVHQEGGGNAVPARPFLGIGDDDLEGIYGIFDAHVDGALTGMVRKTGQPQGRGGRFISFFGA
jgi:hypothetical protein